MLRSLIRSQPPKAVSGSRIGHTGLSLLLRCSFALRAAPAANASAISRRVAEAMRVGDGSNLHLEFC